MENTLTEVTSIWNNIQGNMSTVLTNIGNAVKNGWNAITTSIKTSLENINVKNGIGDRLGGIRDAVSSGLNSAAECIRNIVNSSWQWDYDIMQNLINGIRYMLSDLINTVADVANSIWEYLHFSVPEKGPLTDFESWMPDFMKGLAKGIDKSKKICRISY